MRRQGGDDATGVVHKALAALPIGGDIDDAVVRQCIYGISEEFHRMSQVPENDGFKCIQLQLAGFGCHGNGQVIAHNVKGHLVDYFGDHRIDLARHNGRTVLARGQVNLTQAAAGTGREKP